MSDDTIRGILTETDRKWLRGDLEYEHRQNEADRRAKIRKRVAAALQDFTVLNHHWSRDQRRQTMEGVDDLEAVAAEIIEFLYLSLIELSTIPENMLEKDAPDKALSFHMALCEGIKNGKQHFEKIDHRVLIDSNVAMHEIPSPDDYREIMDTDHWRFVNTISKGSPYSDDDAISKKAAAEELHSSLELTIAEQLSIRRSYDDPEIKRYDPEYPVSGGYLALIDRWMGDEE